MSRHDLVSAQTSNVCITRHAAIACMGQIICNVTSSIVLGRLVQCEQKRWDRDRWVGIHTQRVKTAGLCVGWAVKLLSRVIAQMVTSQGLHAVFKYYLLKYSWLSSPKQLDHKCARMIECNCTCSLEQENHMYRVWLQAECRAGLRSMHSIQRLYYVFTVLVSIFIGKTHNHFLSAILVL